MHTVGYYHNISKTYEGDTVISFKVNDIEGLDKLIDKKLVIDIKKFNDKRSLDANAYFWVLCDKMAKVLGTDKDTIYLMQLQKYGVFTDIEILTEAVPVFASSFRTYEVIDDSGEYSTLRCYIGSSQYDTKQMSDLINGTVNDASDIGIDTWTPEEIERTLALWQK